MIPDLSFQQVEGRNIILFLSQGSWWKLDLDLTSGLCQTVGDGLFFDLSYLFRATPTVSQINLAYI
jgi:hypothetical protein